MNALYHFRCLLIGVSLFVSAYAAAEIPEGYYDALDGKAESELKTATFEAIHSLVPISSYQDLPKYFQKTDVYPDGSNRWWDMYSDKELYAPSFSGLNREHSFPKSWWGGSTTVNAYTDLNHLYPSEMNANSAKSNYPLGEVDDAYKLDFDNGVSKVGRPVQAQGGGAQCVFEPDDEYKGDFARTYFYMVTCYQDYQWKSNYMYMLQQNEYPTLRPWAQTLLLKWHREDPVSQKELDRNETVYSIQCNRNPFIDMPSLAEYIWGDKKGEAFSLAEASMASISAMNALKVTVGKGVLTITCGEIESNCVIYDSMGRAVQRCRLKNGKAEVTLPKGLYIISVEGIGVKKAAI